MNIEHEQCGRCGRKLKTEKSKQAGFGPVCKKKWEAAIAWDKAAKAQDEQLEAKEPIKYDAPF